MNEENGCAVGVGANNTVVICVQDTQSCISITISKEQAQMTAKLLLLVIDSLKGTPT